MSNAAAADKISTLLQFSPEYKELERRAAEVRAALSDIVIEQERNERLVALEHARQRELRFEKIVRILYTRLAGLADAGSVAAGGDAVDRAVEGGDAADASADVHAAVEVNAADEGTATNGSVAGEGEHAEERVATNDDNASVQASAADGGDAADGFAALGKISSVDGENGDDGSAAVHEEIAADGSVVDGAEADGFAAAGRWEGDNALGRTFVAEGDKGVDGDAAGAGADLLSLLTAGNITEIERILDAGRPVGVIRQKADLYVIRGLLAALKYDDKDRLAPIKKNFELALQQERRADILIDYAWLLQVHGMDEEGSALFNEVVNMSDGVAGHSTSPDADAVRKPGSSEIDVEMLAQPGAVREPVDAEILMELAAAFVQKNDQTRARRSYIRSVAVLERHAMSRAEAYLPVLSMALHHLGTMYRNDEEYPEAEAAYNRSIEIRRKLAQAVPPLYEPLLGRTIQSLSRLYIRKNDKERLVNTLYYAANIYERLSADAPSFYEPELSSTYRVLAGTLYENSDRRGARAVWEKALPVQEKLVEIDPVRHERDFLATIVGLGAVHVHYRDFGKAEAIYKKGLDIIEKYRDLNPASYTGDMARLLRYFGRGYLRSGELISAETTLMRALPLYDDLIKTQPEEFRTKKADALTMLEDIYSRIAEPEPSVDFMEKQLAVATQLDEIDRDRHGQRLAGILTSLASEYADADRRDAAIAARVRANEILEELIGRRTGEDRTDAAAARGADAEQQATAAGHRTGVMQGPTAAEQQTTGTEPRVSVAKGGTTVTLDGAIVEDLAAEDRNAAGETKLLPELADNLFWLAILFEKKENAPADETYRRCISIYEGLAAGEAQAYNLRLANALMYYGKYLVGQGHGAEGQPHIDRAIQLTQSHSTDDFAEHVVSELRK